MNKDSIELSEIVSMWGTNDERIGIELENGEIYFAIEVKTYHQFLLGDFNKK